MCEHCMFCQVRSFICCATLRSGCVCSALFALIAGIIYSCITISGAIEHERKHPNQKVTFDEVMRYVAILFYILWAVSGLIMLCAVCRTLTRAKLMPYMVLTCVVIGINIFEICSTIVSMTEGTSMSGQDWSQFFLDIFYTGFQVYSVMVVASYYRNNMTERNVGCC